MPGPSSPVSVSHGCVCTDAAAAAQPRAKAAGRLLVPLPVYVVPLSGSCNALAASHVSWCVGMKPRHWLTTAALPSVQHHSKSSDAASQLLLLSRPSCGKSSLHRGWSARTHHTRSSSQDASSQTHQARQLIMLYSSPCTAGHDIPCVLLAMPCPSTAHSHDQAASRICLLCLALLWAALSDGHCKC